MEKSSATTLLVRVGLWVVENDFDLYEEIVRGGLGKKTKLLTQINADY